MRAALVFPMLFAVIVAGCSAETSASQASEPDTPRPAAAAADEAPGVSDTDLWDTRLTYGDLPDPDATGLERGRQVYDQWCSICHAQGVGMTGTESLMRKYKGEIPAVLTQRDDLDRETVRYFIRNGVSSMPYFRKTEITDADLELVLDYLTQNTAE